MTGPAGATALATTTGDGATIVGATGAGGIEIGVTAAGAIATGAGAIVGAGATVGAGVTVGDGVGVVGSATDALSVGDTSGVVDEATADGAAAGGSAGVAGASPGPNLIRLISSARALWRSRFCARASASAGLIASTKFELVVVSEDGR